MSTPSEPADDDENAELLQQFPKTNRPVYDSRLGDTEPLPDVSHGLQRIVYRVAMPVTREVAERKARGLGIKWQRAFATARYFCFAVYE